MDTIAGIPSAVTFFQSSATFHYDCILRYYTRKKLVYLLLAASIWDVDPELLSESILYASKLGPNDIVHGPEAMMMLRSPSGWLKIKLSAVVYSSETFTPASEIPCSFIVFRTNLPESSSP